MESCISLFGDKAITIESLSRRRGIKSKPILLDNFALLELCSKSINEFEKQERIIISHKLTIDAQNKALIDLTQETEKQKAVIKEMLVKVKEMLSKIENE